MQKKVIIAGYGTVAKELVKLILDQSETMKKKYGMEMFVTAIVSSKGMILEKEGIRLHELLKLGTGSNALLCYAEKFGITLAEPEFGFGQHDVLVDCTPTNIETGEPGLTFFLQALDAGLDVVSVSKGALVHSFQKLKQRAETTGSRFKYSGATAAALPTIDIGEYSLAGSTITGMQGILNGTSNFILSSMNEQGLSFADALKIAQEKGIAESNPALDVQGYDSACKLLLLSNSLLGTNFSLNDVKITGIEQLSKEEMEQAKSKGRRVKLLARAFQERDQVVLEVKPCELDGNHPLFHVNGTNKGIVFETIEMGAVCCTGGASHPRGAAAAALKDVINLYRIF